MRRQPPPGRTLVLKRETLRRLGGLTAAELGLARGGNWFTIDCVVTHTDGRTTSKYCDSNTMRSSDC
jgi:hypothetical protein